MNSVHFKRLLAILLCAVTVLSVPFLAPIEVKAATKEELVDSYKEQIKELEEEQKRLESEIKDLKADKAEQNTIKKAINRKIANLQSQIDTCNHQLWTSEKQVEQLGNEIKAKNAELEEAKFAFKKRIRAIYMSGGMTASSLAVLLSAENFSDLLSKTEITRSLSAYDSALTERVANDIKDIQAKEAEIKKLQEEQEAIKATLNVKKAELKADAKEVNAEISDINSSINSAQNQADAIDKAIKEFEAEIEAALGVGKDQIMEGDFLWPLEKYKKVGSPYGYRIHPISGKRKFHKGVDIGGSGIKGQPIRAAADGTVSIASYNYGGYGYYVMINHGKASDGKSYVTLYAHMSKYIVKVGQKVKKGQTIGYVGTTGASTGYHLHFEIRVNDNPNKHPLNYGTVDPMKFF